MAGVAVGHKCPQCGYDGANPNDSTLVLHMHLDLDNRNLVAMDLECGACHFQWREFLE